MSNTIRRARAEAWRIQCQVLRWEGVGRIGHPVELRGTVYDPRRVVCTVTSGAVVGEL